MEEVGQPTVAPMKPKKEKSKTGFWIKVFTFIIIATMSFSVLAMWQFGDKEEEQENTIQISGYTFYDLGDGTFGTYATLGGQKVPIQFRLDPRNATSIPIEEQAVKQIFTAQKIYITFNPNQKELSKIAVAAVEISRIIGLYGIPVVAAYTEDSNPINPDIPIRTCDDVSETTTIIYLGIGETKINTFEGCVLVTGENTDDLILAADKLGMHLLGIKI